jgi:hypothetical protein
MKAGLQIFIKDSDKFSITRPSRCRFCCHRGRNVPSPVPAAAILVHALGARTPANAILVRWAFPN